MAIEYNISFTDEITNDVGDKNNVVTSIFWEMTCVENSYHASTNGEVVLVINEENLSENFIKFENINDKQSQYMEWFLEKVGQANFDRIKEILYKDLQRRKQANITKKMIQEATVKTTAPTVD